MPSWTSAAELKSFHSGIDFLCAYVNPKYEIVTNISYISAQSVAEANFEEENINEKSFLIEIKSIGRSHFN